MCFSRANVGSWSIKRPSTWWFGSTILAFVGATFSILNTKPWNIPPLLTHVTSASYMSCCASLAATFHIISWKLGFKTLFVIVIFIFWLYVDLWAWQEKPFAQRTTRTPCSRQNGVKREWREKVWSERAWQMQNVQISMKKLSEIHPWDERWQVEWVYLPACYCPDTCQDNPTSAVLSTPAYRLYSIAILRCVCVLSTVFFLFVFPVVLLFSSILTSILISIITSIASMIRSRRVTWR